jgi:hypothetical protein
MDYVSFMRKVDGKPPKPKVDTSGLYYHGDRGVDTGQLGYIREALEGNCDNISAAFTWDSTPQGHSYWVDIYDGTSQLTPADVQYLEWMLEEYS